MTDEAPTPTEFEFSEDDQEEPDVYVTETFVNSYGDERAVLDGDTYNAKDIIKFDWETTHHDWNGENWVVDADALDILGVKLSKAGFTFRQVPEQEAPQDQTLVALAREAEKGDHIAVTYAKKNGNGENTYEGTVLQAEAGDGGRSDQYGGTGVCFEDSDGKTKWVKHGEFGDAALFSGGYHPFMGNVTTVVLGEETKADD